MKKIPNERIGQWLQTGLKAIDANGGQLPSRDVLKAIERREKFSDYEKQRFEKTGYIRWDSVVHFYSIALSKAGWIRKQNGVWYLTAEGKQALKSSPLQFVQDAKRLYRDWQIKNPRQESSVTDSDESEERIEREASYQQAVSAARNEIREYMRALNPYEFQDLVAALLHGMGYYTPFVAPQGKDGGIDILAYRDPFGSTIPRLKIQVKHRQQKVTVKEVRELSSLLIKDGDTGLIVSSEGFTSDAIEEIRRSSRHMEKMDIDDFITLWETYYDNMRQDDKLHLPLSTVHFLTPNED